METPLAIERILLPIDGSPSEHAAIEYAAVLATALRASITLVHVDERPSLMVGIVPGATVDGDLAVERAASMALLDRVTATLAARGVAEPKRRCFVSPRVAAAIVDLARREAFDLIVMATHARTGVSRALLGSVAEQVLRHAPCPVLSVHHPDATE